MKKTIYRLSELPPAFHTAVEHLVDMEMPFQWLFKAVDTDSPTAVFLKDGKTNYRSECSNYSGFWLDGYIGSVQCKAFGHLLPGFFWTAYCQKACSRCAYATNEQKME